MFNVKLPLKEHFKLMVTHARKLKGSETFGRLGWAFSDIFMKSWNEILYQISQIHLVARKFAIDEIF